MFSALTMAQVSFQLGEEIGGEGKNSQTYKAHDPQLGADVVVKKIAKADLANQTDFFAESRALYASAHPNVVQVHYACEDQDHVFVAMPFYKNGSVKSLLHKRHLTVREILQFGCQLLSGLHNIHSKGLVHFDIKSDNVLLSDRNEALISDFGLAKPLENGEATPDGIYQPNVPPEALVNAAHDSRYDIYQAGLTLYCMCIGPKAYSAQYEAYFDANGAFDGARYAADIASGKYPSRRGFPLHVPVRLRNIILKCLEVKPDDRYQSALEVMNQLAQVDGERLDWQFSEGTKGEKVWRKSTQNSTYLFTVYSDLSSTLTKSVNGGAPRKQTDGCKQTISDRDIMKILGNY